MNQTHRLSTCYSAQPWPFLLLEKQQCYTLKSLTFTLPYSEIQYTSTMDNIKRENMHFDIVIVGAGPAGLSAAIRLAQLNKKKDTPLSICVLDKAASIGAHSLSGAVLEPRALNELLPDWKERQAPINTAAQTDHFYYLSQKKAYPLPTPAKMKNKGNYIIQLGDFCRWLGEQAESLGVNLFPGFPASDILYDENKKNVIGVQTSDMGLNRHGEPTERFQAGINLYAKHTLLAEGCRGSLTEEVIQQFNLRNGVDPQSYGIGIKELWKVSSEKHKPGQITHTVGWPLDNKTYGGSFIYHFADNLVSLGLVIGLDYQNPFLDPFQELQRLKTHPTLRSLLEGGECIGYGARALNEGGWQSIPQLNFPGGMLIGCSAGFLNVLKIKGIHTAMKSGMLAAEALHEKTNLNQLIRSSWVAKELIPARNIRPAFQKGLWPGLLYAAVDQCILRGKAPWTFHHKPDHLALKPARKSQKIDYPKPDGKLTFDKLTQVSLTHTAHREDAPCHLILKDTSSPIAINFKQYDAPEQRYCPAGVYEIIEKDRQHQLQINASNCIHCKTCDIKDPTQNIVWKTPEGGEGPNYSGM